MQNMKVYKNSPNFAFFLLIFCGLIIQSCTGWNYWSPFNPYVNTNPTPEYSHPYSMALKGGVVFHLNGYPGGIGTAASTKYSGRACSYSILYLASFGDSSVYSAMKNGGIEKIANVSYEQFAILSFVYHRFCTVVTGE